jgi:membrane protein
VNGAARPSALGRRARDIARLTALSAWAAFRSFYSSDNLTYAASIAYYALLSLFPISFIALAVMGRATASDRVRAAVLDLVLQYFPSQFGFITERLDALQSEPVTLGLVGSGAILWAALGVFGAVSTAVNYAWGVEETRSYWKHKMFSFLMLVVAGLILLVALLVILASRIVGATWFADVLLQFPGLSVLGGLTIRYGTTALFIVVVGLIYYFVPTAEVRFRDVWIGALVTGLLWKAALEIFSWYLRDITRLTRIDGSITAVAVFLVWVYVQAVILLYGVEFTAAYARLRRGRPEKVAAAPARRRY